MKINILLIFLNTLNEAVAEPQKGSTNIVDVVICGSMIGNNNFNSFFLIHIHPSGIASDYNHNIM